MSRKMCVECPHMKVSEGGSLPEDATLVMSGDEHGGVHPCHMATSKPCAGHLRALDGSQVPLVVVFTPPRQTLDGTKETMDGLVVERDY